MEAITQEADWTHFIRLDRGSITASKASKRSRTVQRDKRFAKSWNNDVIVGCDLRFAIVHIHVCEEAERIVVGIPLAGTRVGQGHVRRVLPWSIL